MNKLLSKAKGWATYDLTATKDFFESDAIKNIFDNVSRLIISAAVIFAGNTLQIRELYDAHNRFIIHSVGNILIMVGGFLLLLNILHAYFKARKVHPRAALLILASYVVLAIFLVTSILYSRGMKI